MTIIARATPELQNDYRAACKARDDHEQTCLERCLAWRSGTSNLLFWY